MTHAQGYEPSTRPSGACAGWIAFAAVILTLVGSLNMFQGLIALFDDGFLVARSEDDLLLVDFTVWGAIMVVWGLLVVSAAYALVAGRGWARWFAVFALTARWDEARAAM
jgi:hypothetical protein